VPAEAQEQAPSAGPPPSDSARESSAEVPASPVQRQAEPGAAPTAEAEPGAAPTAETEPGAAPTDSLAEAEEAVPAGFTCSVGSVRPQDALRVDFRPPPARVSGGEPEGGRRESHGEKEQGALVRMAAVFEDCTAAGESCYLCLADPITKNQGPFEVLSLSRCKHSHSALLGSLRQKVPPLLGAPSLPGGAVQ